MSKRHLKAKCLNYLCHQLEVHLNEDMIVAVHGNCNLSNCKLTRKKKLGLQRDQNPLYFHSAVQFAL